MVDEFFSGRVNPEIYLTMPIISSYVNFRLVFNVNTLHCICNKNICTNSLCKDVQIYFIAINFVKPSFKS
jgi:hypothetical protein